MADHSPLPWTAIESYDQIQHQGLNTVLDTNGYHILQAGRDTSTIEDLANFRLIVRCVNAVAGTQPGPVDLDVALCLADQALMGDFPAVGEAIQALVGEVVRLREELQAHDDEMHRQHPVVTPRRVRDELDDESSLSDPIGW